MALRVYDPRLRKMRSCRGLGFRLAKFRPEEVHRIIRDAVLGAVPTARVIEDGRRFDGKAKPAAAGSGAELEHVGGGGLADGATAAAAEPGSGTAVGEADGGA